MTKAEFLNGTPFHIGQQRYKGAPSYKFEPQHKLIVRQHRSLSSEEVIFDTHDCYVRKIGTKMITVFSSVMDKEVVQKIRFEDLVAFEEVSVDSSVSFV